MRCRPAAPSAVRRLAWCGAVVAALAGSAARAAEVPLFASYTAYFSGFRIATVDAALEIGAERYRLAATMRTTGLLALFLRGEQTVETQGAVRPGAGLGVAPERHTTQGRWRDRLRRIALAWADGDPQVLALVPADAEEREPVPPELTRGTIDALTAIVGLMRQVAATGRCEGEAALFDGRRRTDVAARTEGEETLIGHTAGIFAGPALRCAIEGRQIAGFWAGQDRAEAARPRSAVAWLAAPGPGLPPIPVRIDAETGWGPVFIHLTAVGRGEPATPLRESRR